MVAAAAEPAVAAELAAEVLVLVLVLVLRLGVWLVLPWLRDALSASS